VQRVGVEDAKRKIVVRTFAETQDKSAGDLETRERIEIGRCGERRFELLFFGAFVEYERDLIGRANGDATVECVCTS